MGQSPGRDIRTGEVQDTAAGEGFYLDHAGYRRTYATGNPVEFSARQIRVATMDFDDDNIIGRGGFGTVYKGRLQTGQTVAIKALDLSPESFQGEQEFVTEVLVLFTLNHPNVIKMIGYCSEGDLRAIVYEFMQQGSMDHRVREVDSRRFPIMYWKSRVRVALAVARGLHYLHHQANPPVIVRDLKLANILVGEHPEESKISDFGLSKFGASRNVPEERSQLMGTEGYCAPECAVTGIVTPVADVFSFGVILLELLTEKRPVLRYSSAPWSKRYLAGWACRRFDGFGELEQIVNKNISRATPLAVLRMAVRLAVRCVRINPELRPSMAQVVEVMEALKTEELGGSSGKDSFPWLFEDVEDYDIDSIDELSFGDWDPINTDELTGGRSDYNGKGAGTSMDDDNGNGFMPAEGGRSRVYKVKDIEYCRDDKGKGIEFAEGTSWDDKGKGIYLAEGTSWDEKGNNKGAGGTSSDTSSDEAGVGVPEEAAAGTSGVDKGKGIIEHDDKNKGIKPAEKGRTRDGSEPNGGRTKRDDKAGKGIEPAEGRRTIRDDKDKGIDEPAEKGRTERDDKGRGAVDVPAAEEEEEEEEVRRKDDKEVAQGETRKNGNKNKEVKERTWSSW